MSCNCNCNCCANSKTGAQLPQATSFDNLDGFIIFKNSNNRVELALKATTDGFFLIPSNNLDDVQNVTTSQDNLNVYDRSVTYTITQVDALILSLQDELDDKADLVGGNIFDGDQEINGNLTIDTTAGELEIKNVGVGSVELEGSGSIVIDATANLRFETNGVEHFTVLQNGAVGVGNTSPSSSYALDVGGDVNAADFLGDWNSLQTSDFVRSTDGVTEDVTGAKTFTNDDTTFGTGGQLNTITILGDTGESVTITKNLDGTTTISNTNNENTVIDGGLKVDGSLQVEGSGSAVITMIETGVASRSIVYDGTADAFTLQTNTDVQGDMTATNFISDNNISLSGGNGDFISQDGSTGWTGSWENAEGDTVTVKNGIITDVS